MRGVPSGPAQRPLPALQACELAKLLGVIIEG